jgi:dihydropteroate synthase
LQRILDLGIAREKICVDPGIGFAKTPEQNYDLLKNLDSFSSLGYPLLIGLSRKRMLRELLGEDQESLKMGSVAAGLFAVQHGAHIVRVHDVAATKSALKVWENLQL